MQTNEAINLLYERIVMLEREYNKERDRADRAEKIISVLVDDMGGEVEIPVGRIETASQVLIDQDGEGRDDELTITVLYPS